MVTESEKHKNIMQNSENEFQDRLGKLETNFNLLVNQKVHETIVFFLYFFKTLKVLQRSFV